MEPVINGGAASGGLRTLIIDNYDSYTFNLCQLIAEVNQGELRVVRNPRIPAIALPPHAAAAAAAAAATACTSRPAALPTVLRNDEVDWPTLAARIEAGEWHNIVISPGPGTPARAADVGERTRLAWRRLPFT